MPRGKAPRSPLPRPSALPVENVVWAPVSREPYTIEDGVLVERTDVNKTDRISREQAEVEATHVAPELRTRGAGCLPDDVDTSVRVRFTQPKRKA